VGRGRTGSRKVRIGILGARGYPSTYGGFETFVRRIAPWLVERGHEVTVYSHTPSEAGEREWCIDRVRVVATWGLDSKAAATASHGMAAAMHAARERPDVVLVLNVANGFILPLLRARRIRTVVNVDGIEWERGKWGSVAKTAFKAGARMSARFADVLIADSQAVAARWRADFDATAAFIPYGADVTDSSESDLLTIRTGLTPKRYALAVARLVPENNVELFVNAIEHLDWKIPTVVVGSANYDNPLERRLRSLNESGKIVWLGHVADQRLLHQLWANASVYFHGHSVGGTNPGLLQAMGAGAPTIALDTVFNREVLQSDEQLVPHSVERVAEALDRIFRDPIRQSSLAATGRALVLSRYSWQSVCEDYERHLAATVDRPSGDRRANATQHH
jgi:glycosyltransferase involved in cell wall biosynthesis